ncbi:hypothetical protein D515_00916 [Grimontia indica]|uniref:Stress-response A/B barrel domain-containing protein n=2 Tax=Grimontia TaxID=246861 RepID=R1IRI4_9GAMM|nr:MULTISPECIES: Dabb family protein [Grimontia]EOD80092.1 hypothetical protein D515_00916 [Grimontia indica]USH04379.1 Dabb family protein [Grimontia kaedaensis]
MIRHILLIKFIESATEDQINHIKALFLDVPKKIDGVVSVEWGENDSDENLNKGCTHAVLMTFANQAGREQYLPHPEHDKLKLDFVPLIEDITVFDYSL